MHSSLTFYVVTAPRFRYLFFSTTWLLWLKERSWTRKNRVNPALWHKYSFMSVKHWWQDLYLSLELNPCSEYPLIAFNRKLKPSWAEWSSGFLQASPKFRGMTWKIALTWFMYICVCPAAEKSSQLNLNFLFFPLFQDLRTTTMSGPSPIQTPTPSSSVSTSAALKHSTACWKRFDALFFFFFFYPTFIQEVIIKPLISLSTPNISLLWFKFDLLTKAMVH